MTCGTEDDNDPYKIDINLENDEYRLRKGLSSLLNDEYFLLLYVPENEGRMQVVRPANDSYHRKRMIKRVNEAKPIPSFYYALSHLWGLKEDNRYLWNEIGDYVDDEEGQPMKPVSMRPEKREPLLQLLKDHPDSYWWIDVLCARYDTPLDIMGDIYACCLECIAMIDCESTLIPQIHAELADVVELQESCRKPTEELLEYRAELYQTKGPQLIELLDTFFQCEWWQRVWTWQEMALPLGDVRFMAETDIHRLETNTITLNEVLGFRPVLEVYKALRPGIQYKYNNSAAFNEVHSSLQAIYYSRKNIDSDIGPRFDDVLGSLMLSKRRCYDPCDYVYGVLGVMRIKIPRMSDPNAVWRHFLLKLDDLIPLVPGKRVDFADKIDLREAEDIGDVYRMLYALSLILEDR